MAVRQHGMVQFTRGEDSALDDPKVDADVGVTRLGDEARMSFGVHTGFVHPRVQGGVVNIMDLLARGHAMVQFDGIGTTPAEGVTRVDAHERRGSQRYPCDVTRGQANRMGETSECQTRRSQHHQHRRIVEDEGLWKEFPEVVRPRYKKCRE